VSHDYNILCSSYIHLAYLHLKSIIAVHGLDGHRDQSWTADSNKKMWLKDFLPLDIPNARIFTYGYNASTHGNPGIEFLDQHAEGFVDHLCLNLPDVCNLFGKQYYLVSDCPDRPLDCLLYSSPTVLAGFLSKA
jgi:hypothetical protein